MSFIISVFQEDTSLKGSMCMCVCACTHKNQEGIICFVKRILCSPMAHKESAILTPKERLVLATPPLPHPTPPHDTLGYTMALECETLCFLHIIFRVLPLTLSSSSLSWPLCSCEDMGWERSKVMPGEQKVDKIGSRWL